MPLQQAEWLKPLRAYYVSAGVPLPSITVIDSRDIPQPYYDLLIHREDMTSVLERYHSGMIELRLLRVSIENGQLTRQVVLVLAASGKPVEFGAIRIHLGRFGPEAQQMILEGRRPLGGILKEHGIEYISRPGGFIRFRSDAIVNPLLGLTGEHELFGRYTTLYDATAQSLAEVIEILPPIGDSDPGKGEA